MELKRGTTEFGGPFLSWLVANCWRFVVKMGSVKEYMF